MLRYSYLTSVQAKQHMRHTVNQTNFNNLSKLTHACTLRIHTHDFNNLFWGNDIQSAAQDCPHLLLLCQSFLPSWSLRFGRPLSTHLNGPEGLEQTRQSPYRHTALQYLNGCMRGVVPLKKNQVAGLHHHGRMPRTESDGLVKNPQVREMYT
jgi:hypothetical protein